MLGILRKRWGAMQGRCQGNELGALIHSVPNPVAQGRRAVCREPRISSTSQGALKSPPQACQAGRAGDLGYLRPTAYVVAQARGRVSPGSLDARGSSSSCACAARRVPPRVAKQLGDTKSVASTVLHAYGGGTAMELHVVYSGCCWRRLLLQQSTWGCRRRVGEARLGISNTAEDLLVQRDP